MKTFKVVIETRREGVVTQEIEAVDEQQARTMARSSGRVVSIKPITKFKLFQLNLPPEDRQVFIQRLAAMQASKVGAGEALSLMGTTFTGPIKRVADTMLRHIEAGMGIGEAMAKMPGDFPKNVVALVQAGERGGDTASALKNAAGFEEEMDRIKRTGGGGIKSGIIGFLVAVAVTLGTTEYFGPMVLDSDLVKLSKTDLTEDPMVQLGMMLAKWTSIAMWITAGLFMGLILLSSVVKRIIPTQADAMIMKIPVYKDLVLSRNNYTTLYGLSMLVGSGVSMEAALSITAENAPKGSMKDDLSGAVQNIKRGLPWAHAMDGLHPTDKAALSSSQDREQVAVSLQAIADQYRTIYSTRVAITGPALQMIATLFLVVSGFVLFTLTVIPILKMASDGF